MVENDPLRDRAAPRAPHGPLRSALWVVLVLSATANLVVSSVGAVPGVNLACGTVTAGCAVALAALWRRGRRV